MISIEYNNLPFSPDDLTDKERNFALGQFMTAWSQVESVYGFIFRELSEVPPETATIIFDRVGTREQLEIVAALCDSKFEGDHRTSAESLFKAIEAISVARNKVVHAGWGAFNQQPARFWHGITSAQFLEIGRQTPKGKSLQEKYIFTTHDLGNLTEKCVSLRTQLEALLDRLIQKKFEKLSDDTSSQRFARRVTGLPHQ